LTRRREAHGHDTGHRTDQTRLFTIGALPADMTLAIKRNIVFPGRGVVAIEDTVLVTTGPPESLTITSRELVVL